MFFLQGYLFHGILRKRNFSGKTEQEGEGGKSSMKRRIGILTSGGDCPGLNAAIRGVARASYEMFDCEIIGIHDGYRGLIDGDWQLMK